MIQGTMAFTADAIQGDAALTGATDTEPRAEAGVGHRDGQDVVRDLEQRIAELSRAEDAEFGRFTLVDWVLCLGAFVLFPYIAFLCFWP